MYGRDKEPLKWKVKQKCRDGVSYFPDPSLLVVLAYLAALVLYIAD
jgi:hypothetical protein